MNLGELFIQLAFQGDTKEADKFIEKTKKIIEQTEIEIKKNRLLIKYLDDLSKARAKEKAAKENIEKTKNEKREVSRKDLNDRADALAEIERLKRNFKSNIKFLDFDDTQKAVEDAKNRFLSSYKKAESEIEKNLLRKQFKKEIKLILSEKDKNAAENKIKKILDLKNSIKKTAFAVAGYVTAISGAIYAVNRLTESLINQNQQWLNLTRTSTVALSTYQKWNAIGKMFGIDNAAQQIKNLNDRLFELKLTGANAQGFMLAGINPTNADDVMEQLRNRVKGLNDNAASYLLKQMGLDENMLHILRMERSEFEKLNNKIKEFQLTDKQRKSLQQMNVQLQIASQQIQYLKDRAILAILPAWVKFIKLIAKLGTILGKAFKYIKNNIKTIAATLAVFSLKFIPFVKIIKSVPGILQNIVKFFPAIKGFLLRVGALLWRTFLPLTALYLLFDDIFTYLEGGDSVTGDVIKWFTELKDSFDEGFGTGILDFLTKLRGNIIDVISIIWKFIAKITNWDWVKRLSKEFDDYYYGQNDDIPTDEALRGGFTEEEYANLKAKGDAKRAEIANKRAMSNINKIEKNNISNLNNQTTIHQQNNINTTETAKDVLNSLLPFTNAAFSGGSI